MKICSQCEILLPLEDFSWKNKTKGIKCSYCKSCQRIKSAAHYKSNKEDYINRAKTQNKEIRIFRQKLISEKKKSGCVYCGEDWQHALDLHHIYPDDKIDVISKIHTKKKIITELEKTIVLCANCHRKYHSKHREINLFISELVNVFSR